MHNVILVLWRENGMYVEQVIDPAMGRAGRKYYIAGSAEKTDDLQVNIKGMTVDLYMPLNGRRFVLID